MVSYLVIGARGKTGQHVVTSLASRDVVVRAGSRRPDEPDSRAGRIQPVRFDWEDPATWAPALRGVTGVYLVKPESSSVVDDVAAFLVAMSQAGVRRLVLLSEVAAETREEHTPERAVERLVEASDLDWTILRPNWFMQDIVDPHFFRDMIVQDSVLVLTTGGAGTAWIDARDIGEVAAHLLVSATRLREAVPLTGPEALTLDQLVDLINRVAGLAVSPVEEPPAAVAARLSEAGATAEIVDFFGRISQSIIDGDTAAVTTAVESILGRPARSFEAFLADYADHLTSVVAVETTRSPSGYEAASRANEQLFRRQIDAWARNDFDALLECFADDMVYIDMPFETAPVRGKPAFLAHIRAYNAQFDMSDFEVEILALVANPTGVVGELRTTARYVGQDAPRDGARISWTATLVDTVVDGRVTTEHVYFDPSSFSTALAAHSPNSDDPENPSS